MQNGLKQHFAEKWECFFRSASLPICLFYANDGRELARHRILEQGDDEDISRRVVIDALQKYAEWIRLFSQGGEYAF